MTNRLIHYFSAQRIITILFLYEFVVQAFIRSIVPVLIASNYRLPFRFHVLALELWFLLKASYGLVFRKSFRTERFLGYEMRFANYLEFALLFIETFGIQEYRLHIRKKRLKIVDCGSGWGMSIIYLKHFHPKARIVAVEANADTVMLLRENIRRNKIRNVRIQTAFVCGREGQHAFYRYRGFSGWSVSDTGASDFAASNADSKKIQMPAVSLSELLRNGADVVKLDIEGMEGEAIASAQKMLSHVKEVIIEHHPGMNRKRNTHEQIVTLLTTAGFRVSTRNTKYLFPTKNALRMIYAVKQ